MYIYLYHKDDLRTSDIQNLDNYDKNYNFAPRSSHIKNVEDSYLDENGMRKIEILSIKQKYVDNCK